VFGDVPGIIQAQTLIEPVFHQAGEHDEILGKKYDPGS
jgi:hypothetical protein